MTIFEELETYTKQLVFSTVIPRVTEVPTPVGPSIMTGLFNSGKIAVADVFVPKGGDSVMHCHDEFAIFVIYEGGLEITMGPESKERIEYNAPCTLEIPPKQLHQVFLERTYCRMLAITIPAATEWPGGQE